MVPMGRGQTGSSAVLAARVFSAYWPAFDLICALAGSVGKSSAINATRAEPCEIMPMTQLPLKIR